MLERTYAAALALQKCETATQTFTAKMCRRRCRVCVYTYLYMYICLECVYVHACGLVVFASTCKTQNTRASARKSQRRNDMCTNMRMVNDGRHCMHECICLLYVVLTQPNPTPPRVESSHSKQHTHTQTAQHPHAQAPMTSNPQVSVVCATSAHSREIF